MVASRDTILVISPPEATTVPNPLEGEYAALDLTFRPRSGQPHDSLVVGKLHANHTSHELSPGVLVTGRYAAYSNPGLTASAHSNLQSLSMIPATCL